MNQTGFQTYLFDEAKRRQEEIIKSMEKYRLLQEAKHTRDLKPHRESKILALLGKELTSLGNNLETRYGNRADGQASVTRLGNTNGCS